MCIGYITINYNNVPCSKNISSEVQLCQLFQTCRNCLWLSFPKCVPIICHLLLYKIYWKHTVLCLNTLHPSWVYMYCELTIWPASCWLEAQLVEHCTCTTEVMDWNPIEQAWIFFILSFCNFLSCVKNCEGLSSI